MLYIDGTWRAASSGATFAVSNPATGEIVGTVADAGGADIDAAIESATHAFPAWSQATAGFRSRILLDAYLLMLERKEHLARLMTEEQGKPLKAARNEVQ